MPQTDASSSQMTLDKLIDKLKDINRKLFDKFGHLYYASLAYVGIKGLDITSTSLYLHEQNNLNAEANDLTRDLMEQYGINAGLMIKNVPMAAIIFLDLPKQTKIKGVRVCHMNDFVPA